MNNFPFSKFHFPSIFNSKDKWQRVDDRWQIQRAFTLIELLVVISIIGILIGLSVFGFQGARVSARDAVRKTDVEEIRSGLAMYKADCDTYPSSDPSAVNPFNLTTSSSLVGDDSTPSCSGKNTYISAIPVDPLSPNQSYVYVSDGVTYEICTSLEQVGSVATSCSGCGGSSGCNYEATNP